jgi:cytochrome c biogenesis protein CcdA
MIKKNFLPSRYLLLIIVTGLLALSGYAGFRLYPTLSQTGATDTSLFILAAMAGIASLFSPCSFPLLVTVLSRRVGEENGRFTSLLHFATAFTIGTILFLLLTGAIISLGAAPLISRITFTSIAGRVLRFFVALLLIGVGWWQVRGRSLTMGWLNTALQPLWRMQFRLRRRRSTVSAGLYGFGYILAGFG